MYTRRNNLILIIKLDLYGLRRRICLFHGHHSSFVANYDDVEHNPFLHSRSNTFRLCGAETSFLSKPLLLLIYHRTAMH